MIKKEKEKEVAINLRKQGKTYSEILSTVSVAKSTLAIWLQSVNLSKKQKQRINKQNKIFSEAKSEIGSFSKRELFLAGVFLYWAEGAKEKEYYPGSPLRFANSDPYMIKLFLNWLQNVGVKKERICFDIYLHKNNKYRVLEVIDYWSRHTGFSKKLFRVYYKKDIPKTKRKNIHPDTYFGLVRIYVKESSDLVRSISGWVQGIVEHLK